jgi:hypothetical protein
VRYALAIVTGLSSLLAACAADDASSGPASPTSDGSESVQLSTATPEHLAGRYTDTQGRTIDFDSTRDGDVLELDVRTAAHVLVHVETVGDEYRFSYYDGRARLTVDKAWVADPREEDAQWDGDPTSLDEELALPEVADLPWLSRQLGVMGYTGSDYPSSLALHKIARQSADALGIQVPPLVKADEGGDKCARPSSNECYGMCGPGCSCWSWVCGDCCYHSGCARHDDWCRQGQWYWCYNITAVVALFGC